MNKFIGFRVLKFFVLIFFILSFSIASGQTGNINTPSHDNAVILGSRYSIVDTYNISESDFIRGADISTFPQIDAFGGKFSVNGKTTNLLDILSDNGVNYIRLRLWHTPRDWYCGLESTLEIAKKVKAHGFKLLLDFHYSDWWADPANQKKPTAWEKLPFALLKDSVYAYTYRVISLLKAEDALPDMVQIGNEISPGMLFPDGAVSGTTGWEKLAQLLNAGITAVHAAANNTNTSASAISISDPYSIKASGNSTNSTRSANSTPAPGNFTRSTRSENSNDTSSIKIMLHLDSGGDNAKSRWWFNNIMAQNVPFDIIGLSYYPWWHGTLNDLKNNMNDLAVRYNKDIIVVETAYPMTNRYLNDGMDNVGFDEQKLIPGYPVSVKGQTDFLFTLKNLVKETANKKGIGFFYWEPAWIWQKPFGTAWEYYTLFDPVSGELLPSIEPFNEADSTGTGIDEGTAENGNPQFPQDPNNPKYPGANEIPSDIVLYQNYPNPFNPTTIIQYYLPESALVTLKIYDLLGREVGELVNDTQSAGVHRIALNADQHHLTSGVYIYSITIYPNSDGVSPSHSGSVNPTPHYRTSTPRTISKAMILVK
jgi:arabinogalactan endo-1,4-beta-galactosidase